MTENNRKIAQILKEKILDSKHIAVMQNNSAMNLRISFVSFAHWL